MIILWDDFNKMTVWSSIALAYDSRDLVKGLLEANSYMGENYYVKATNDLGDTVYLKYIAEVCEHDWEIKTGMFITLYACRKCGEERRRL